MSSHIMSNMRTENLYIRRIRQNRKAARRRLCYVPFSGRIGWGHDCGGAED